MTGPMPAGHWMANIKPESWSMLHPGGSYRITQAFRDYDGFHHLAGEGWTFLGFSFLPYDDGLSLFISLDGQQEWHIRMQWRPEEQGPILDRLCDYITEIPLKVKTAPPPPPPRPVPFDLKTPTRLLGISSLAVVAAFVLLHQSERSQSFVVPSSDSLAFAFSGFALGAAGLLGALIAIIWIVVRSSRSR